MRKFWFGAALAALSLLFAGAFATARMQNSDALDFKFNNLKATGGGQTREQTAVNARKIEQIKLGANGFGWARTAGDLWRTNDNGKTWRQIAPAKSAGQIIGGAWFADEQNGFVVLANGQSNSFELAKTADGGDSWTTQNINLPGEILAEAGFDRVSLRFTNRSAGLLGVRLTSSSNFTRAAFFSTADGGATWRLARNLMEKGEVSLETEIAQTRNFKSAIVRAHNKTFELPVNAEKNVEVVAPLEIDESVTAARFADARTGWLLVESGRCRNSKSNCEQTARILTTVNGGENWFDATPDAATRRRADAEIFAQNANFSELFPASASQSISASSRLRAAASLLPPGGATRISINRGFDKCTASTVAQMQTWWDNSPFTDANIYIAGRNRGCAQPQLTAAWVDQVSNMGYGLIPTIVGYQAPCSVCTNCQKHSTDPAIAETQGREEADISILAANNLGLTQGTILYYDMERYDNPAGTTACSTAVKGFLKGWTDRVKEQGYISGVYGSPTNAVADWISIPEASRMDAIWMARWDNVGSTWFYAAPSPAIPISVWNNHQRIKQFQAPHNETWGGVTFNIDGNIADAPVAGARAPKNKPSDFDGDGKTDLAIFRPSEGTWYVLNSRTGAFNAAQFGSASDIIAPGDYDGDGRTDYAVFRPENGVWFELSAPPARPAAAVTRIRQFGTAGDIPVAADYDGDNITDLAVFRQGVWYITNSFDGRSPNYRVEYFGLSDDVPTPGDFDGDGKADLAVFRPSTGVWYVQQSRDGFYAAQFGANGDRAVPGDYDGDGKTDIAVWRPADGVWFILKSGGEIVIEQFGVASDKPAPGDFDGDNKWDLAVFRPSTGFWYLQQSRNGFAGAQFGAEIDRPIAGGYIPQ